jgi:hypothetical protein
LKPDDAVRYTAALVPLVERGFAENAVPSVK